MGTLVTRSVWVLVMELQLVLVQSHLLHLGREKNTSFTTASDANYRPGYVVLGNICPLVEESRVMYCSLTRLAIKLMLVARKLLLSQRFGSLHRSLKFKGWELTAINCSAISRQHLGDRSGRLWIDTRDVPFWDGFSIEVLRPVYIDLYLGTDGNVNLWCRTSPLCIIQELSVRSSDLNIFLPTKWGCQAKAH